MQNLFSSALALTIAAAAFLTPKTSAAWEVEDPTATVHLQGAAGIRLERRDTPREAWRVACAAPCDLVLPIAAEYRVTDAKGGTVQDAFRLQAAPDAAIIVNVERSNSGRKVAGVALVVLGAAAIVGSVAATWALERTIQEDKHCRRPSDRDEYADYCDYGWQIAISRIAQFYTVLFGAAGVVGVAGGGYMLATPSSRMIQYTDEKPPAEAYARHPTFTAQSSAPSFAGVVVPLSFRF